MDPSHTGFNGGRWRKQAALFLLSQNLSLFGSSVVDFAIFWHILLETSSGFWLMLATLCSMGPQVAISLWAGVWADRYHRKYLIMLTDGFIALTTLALAAAWWAGYQRIELLLLASVFRSLGTGIQTPAVGAIYPQLVPQNRLTRVQGINQTLNSILMLLAPAAGGFVLGAMGIGPAFMVDVVTASLAIAVLSFIKVERIRREGEPAPVLTELKEGVAYVLGHPPLRRLIACYACSFFFITPAAVLSPLLVERSFGSDIWLLTANEMSWAVGSLLGGVLVSLRGEFKDKPRTIALCLVGLGVALGMLGVARPFAFYLAMMGIAGCFMPVMVTAQTVFIQETAEPTMLGRVFSMVQIISAGAIPVGILFFGPAADAIPVETIMVASGALLALVGFVYGRTAAAAGDPAGGS